MSLEIIHLRSSGVPLEDLGRRIRESLGPESHAEVTLYRRQGLESDVAVHIRQGHATAAGIPQTLTTVGEGATAIVHPHPVRLVVVRDWCMAVIKSADRLIGASVGIKGWIREEGSDSDGEADLGEETGLT